MIFAKAAINLRRTTAAAWTLPLLLLAYGSAQADSYGPFVCKPSLAKRIADKRIAGKDVAGGFSFPAFGDQKNLWGDGHEDRGGVVTASRRPVALPLLLPVGPPGLTLGVEMAPSHLGLAGAWRF